MSKSEVKIEITRDADGVISAQMQGSAIPLLSCLLAGVNQIYKRTPDKAARDAFRDTVIRVITRFDSPVWNTNTGGEEGTCVVLPILRKESDGE